MTFRMYILFMSIATVLAWLAWSFVVWNTNPLEAGASGFVMFYLTLVMGLVGTLTLLGVCYRVLLLKRRDVITREVRISFRHAVFLAVIGVTTLAFSAPGLLHWWVFLILIVGISLVEYFFLVKEESRRI